MTNKRDAVSELEVLTVLRKNVPNIPDGDTVDLIDEHYIDSYSFIEVIMQIEEEFDVDFTKDLMKIDNLRSIKSITRCVNELLSV